MAAYNNSFHKSFILIACQTQTVQHRSSLSTPLTQNIFYNPVISLKAFCGAINHIFKNADFFSLQVSDKFIDIFRLHRESALQSAVFSLSLQLQHFICHCFQFWHNGLYIFKTYFNVLGFKSHQEMQQNGFGGVH